MTSYVKKKKNNPKTQNNLMEIFELCVRSGLILNKSFRTLSGQWLNMRYTLCDCMIMWGASSGRHRSRICHASLAARVSPNHFSQFIIRCLFHWLTCVAAGACAVAGNWTARPQPRSRPIFLQYLRALLMHHHFSLRCCRNVSFKYLPPPLMKRYGCLHARNSL